MPPYSTYSPLKKEQARTDFIFKFYTLRQFYPEHDIPIPTANDTLEELFVRYETCYRRISIAQGNDQYKIYLIIFFLVVEFCCCKVGLKCTGYTIMQLTLMDKYERLLIELGEKNYGGFGTGWPVEIRLLMLAVFNAVILIIINTLAGALGPTLADTIRQTIIPLLNGKSPTFGATPAPAPRYAPPQAPGANPSGVPDPIPPSNNTGSYGGTLANLGSMAIQGIGALGGDQSAAPPAEKPTVRRRKFQG